MTATSVQEAFDHKLLFGSIPEEALEFENEMPQISIPRGIKTFNQIQETQGLTTAVNIYAEHVGHLPSSGFRDGSYLRLLKDPALEERAHLLIVEQLGNKK